MTLLSASDSATLRDQIWRIRPEYTVTELSPDELLFSTGLWSGARLVLHDENARGVLAALVTGLDGATTPSQVLRSLGSEPDDTVEDLLELLAKHDVVDLVPGGGDNRVARDASLAAQIAEAVAAPWHIAADLAAARLQDAVVLVLGDAPMTALLLDHLSQWGVGRVLHNGSDRRTLVQETEFEALASVADALDRAAEATLLITATAVPDPRLTAAANEACLAHRVAWIPLTFDGPEALLGPAILPFQTPCYQCFETRASATLRNPGTYELIRQGRRSPNEIPLRRTPSSVQALGAMAAQEAARLIATGTTISAGRLIRMNAGLLLLEAHEILKVPRCPSCGRSATTPTYAPPYYSLEAVINALAV